jgi:hypothetical protein
VFELVTALTWAYDHDDAMIPDAATLTSSANFVHIVIESTGAGGDVRVPIAKDKLKLGTFTPVAAH